jgi:hypothetical protein
MLAVMFDCTDQIRIRPFGMQSFPRGATRECNSHACTCSRAGLPHATILRRLDQGPIGSVCSAFGRAEGTILRDVYSQVDETRKKALRLRRAARSFAQGDAVNWPCAIALRLRGRANPRQRSGEIREGLGSKCEKPSACRTLAVVSEIPERFVRLAKRSGDIPQTPCGPGFSAAFGSDSRGEIFFVRRSSGRSRRGPRRPRCCATGSRGPWAAAGCWPSTATGAAAAGRGRWWRRPRTGCGRDR